MFGMIPKEDTTCPNCGDSGFDHKKKGYECVYCGFHKPEYKEQPAVCLVFCQGCGCTYSSPCSLHPADKQNPVK